MLFYLHSIQHISSVSLSDLPATGCTNSEVRLVAREAVTSGLVEVCEGGTWRRLCSTWTVNEASVTCRQLNRTVGMYGNHGFIQFVDL